MKLQTKPFQQNMRKMHPSLEPQVKEKINKLLATIIIFSVRHTQCISNLVPVRKKNGDIRLCVDFRNLNKASEKYNYPVQPMEQIIQYVSGSERISLLDDFSSYNQFLVSHDDQLKIAFRTKCETYAYRKMSFGLINIGATFQRDMDITFRVLIGDCVVVYLDDVTIFSKYRKDYIAHFRKIFNRYRRYDISLNPQKYVFAINEGIILGFIVSKDGMMIEPKRIEAISKIPPPHNKFFM
jgi:hypothetical protein